MDLRGIANMATSLVNPNETVKVLRSIGYTSGAGAKQIPKYEIPICGPAQIQALDNSDLKHIEGLNIQGDIRAIYLRGSLAGVIRPDQTGGDLIKRGFPEETWLVTKVIETWPTWTKALIVRQQDMKNAGDC